MGSVENNKTIKETEPGQIEEEEEGLLQEDNQDSRGKGPLNDRHYNDSDSHLRRDSNEKSNSYSGKLKFVFLKKNKRENFD